jgi:ABC-type transport system involved in multi-copper enzyme maturation permease subunit
MLFAVGLILEREPLQWNQFLGAANLWLQNAGLIAAIGLGIWVLASMVQRGKPFAALVSDAPPRLRGPLASLVGLLALVSLLGFVVMAGVGIVGGIDPRRGAWMPRAGQGDRLTTGDYIFSISGFLALLIALTPMLLGLSRLRAGRIWALARLSVKEAVRSRVVLVFAFMAIIFLFADWFVPFHRGQDQVRNYVRVVYWSITPLFLMMAGLLGSLSIPNDIKSQSIHTIVTKPVEKFEIVLGRFLGYAALLTVGLAVIAVLSLGYVARGVHPQAAEESFKARVPVFGELKFEGTSREKGDSVGREWEYRGYIMGAPPGAMRKQFAVWRFYGIPDELAAREQPVVFEYTFDIFRLSKGEENKDIPCTFTFLLGDLPEQQAGMEMEKRLAAIQQAERNKPHEGDPEEVARAHIEKYGVYTLPGQEVTDYHTQTLTVPPALFKKAVAAAAERKDAKTALLTVVLSVDPASQGQSQMVGVAQRDLYLLADERPFWTNFLKGIVGMWCMYMLVLGIAVACSTYLSGMIAWLCTMFLFGAGMFTQYLQELAANQVPGGGPMEAIYRLGTAKVMAAQLDPGPATSVMRATDDAFTWVLRRLLNLIPDVNRFDLHAYVANGFDVPWAGVLLVDNLIPLVAYLVPWAILAYYLMRYREIANPT